MQLASSLVLAVAALSAASVHGFYIFSTEPLEAEHHDVAVSEFYSAVAVTSLGHAGNYLNAELQPICVTDVLRVREAVVNATRDLFVEVNGCSVDAPRGLCDTKCQVVPFEVNVRGAEATPGFDPVASLRLGQPVESPYKVLSIGVLL